MIITVLAGTSFDYRNFAPTGIKEWKDGTVVARADCVPFDSRPMRYALSATRNEIILHIQNRVTFKLDKFINKVIDLDLAFYNSEGEPIGFWKDNA